MKIRMIAGLSGPKVSLAPGDVRDFPNEKEAQRLIDAKFAELVVEDATASTAIDETPAERVARLEAELADAKAAHDAVSETTERAEPDAAPAAPVAAETPATKTAASKATQAKPAASKA